MVHVKAASEVVSNGPVEGAHSSEHIERRGHRAAVTYTHWDEGKAPTHGVLMNGIARDECQWLSGHLCQLLSIGLARLVVSCSCHLVCRESPG